MEYKRDNLAYLKNNALPTQSDSPGHFSRRHIGLDECELQEMLTALGLTSLDQLMDETIPVSIRIKKPLDLTPPSTEYCYLEELRKVASKNKVFKTFIGLGYYDCVTPGVIQRNILENPGWYTQYTPYQAEISQGRLEALINFQTMVTDLTGMEIANASLLDEGTAAAEAMTMLFRIRQEGKVRGGADGFFVSELCLPQTVDVLRTRAEPLGIRLLIGDHVKFEFDGRVFGALLQYPNADGEILDYSHFIRNAHDSQAMVAMAADLLCLTLVTPPGELSADVVVGSTQRFGVPLGYGGPHAAYFATRDKYKRQIPGRIIGASIDRHGNTAYRMALQTREQHIRREKATSNICTAQSLPAIMSAMYAVYHGPDGLRSIAKSVNRLTRILEIELNKLGYTQTNRCYFDTLKVDLGESTYRIRKKVESLSRKAQMNFRYISNRFIGISLDETVGLEDISRIVKIFAHASGAEYGGLEAGGPYDSGGALYSGELARKSDFLTHPVFNSYHSETKMLRYIKTLESRDLSLTTSMIPLGSCTMKLNATSEMMPISWPEFSRLHPFVPLDQTQGYAEIIMELERFLTEITGFPSVSLQPNSGAQGEYTGLMVIRAYYRDIGERHRNIVLVPASAHGTNPASAVLSGMNVVVVSCDGEGNIDFGDLVNKVSEHRDNLAAIMITYPSTHGVFEEKITDICSLVHDNGGQVYMDGANMNAQVGLTSPSTIGADICHLNLHKTFSIPHGGGGPGMGPICAAEHLSPYLPGHPLVPVGGRKSITAVASAPWGSGSILLISYGYIRMLGSNGVTDASKVAILNANYLKFKLEKYYRVLYDGTHGRVAHEFILDLRPLKTSFGIDVEDVAKRLIDYGFHAPTISWPVPGTMMIEPTESEGKGELDRFCDALIEIYHEAMEISAGTSDSKDNVLKNSPHTAEEALSGKWSHPYTREKAVYPLPFVKINKFWPPVGRINNAYGDKNLACVCPPIDAYPKKGS
jgi:glycine cleavage system P protein (glycine dehydrogenase)